MRKRMAVAVVGTLCGIVRAEAVRESRPDALLPVPAADVRIGGYLGQRLDRNLHGILRHKDEDALLEPFRKRGPDQSAWIGEHAGKWLSAASWMYAYARDEQMLAKLQRVAGGLMAAQMADGYLGTYAEKDRWTSWDVWIHKYNLLGLLDYYDATADVRALEACRKMGDLLARTFGPGGRDLVKAGEHLGMAATSILQPILILYRRTGEPRYLGFADSIVEQTEQAHGSRIISTLLEKGSVREVATAKAYEMLSNIIGLLDLYRLRGDPRMLRAATLAFDDIAGKRLYITGGSSYGELFREPGYLPNMGHVGETCVTMSLMQFYRDLQRLTAEAKYAASAEHLIYNHLLACQHPTGESICYYTPLWGHKFYMSFLGCCISSGPRALAVVPSMYYLRSRDAVVVDLIGASTLDTVLADGTRVRVAQRTDYPFAGQVSITASADGGNGCALTVRVPAAALNPTISVDGRALGTEAFSDSRFTVRVRQQPVDIDIDLNLAWKIVEGTGANAGLFALQYGPVICAFDLAANREVSGAINCAFDMRLESLAPRLLKQGERWTAQVNGYVRQADKSWLARRLTLLPYADAGEHGYFSVWLADRARFNENGVSLFTQVHENCSRKGKNQGSIADNSTATYTSTDNGEKRDQDWFEVDAGWHTQENVIVFRHGKSTSEGGWFDTSKGKPKVLVKTWGDYRELAEISDYPATTAESPGSLQDGQAFRVVIPKDKREAPFRFRVVGTPSCGSDPTQNSASCSEIQVFYEPEEEVLGPR